MSQTLIAYHAEVLADMDSELVDVIAAKEKNDESIDIADQNLEQQTLNEQTAAALEVIGNAQSNDQKITRAQTRGYNDIDRTEALANVVGHVYTLDQFKNLAHDKHYRIQMHLNLIRGLSFSVGGCFQDYLDGKCSIYTARTNAQPMLAAIKEKMEAVNDELGLDVQLTNIFCTGSA